MQTGFLITRKLEPSNPNPKKKGKNSFKQEKKKKGRKRNITNEKHPKKKYMIYTHHEHQKTPEKYIYMNLHLKYEKKDTMDKHISRTSRSNGTYNLTLNNTCYSTTTPKYK